MPDLPARTKDYVGPVTDTRIWDRFELREDDIILSTPPKCGTTWSQALLMMLIHGQAVADRQVWRDSLWLDCVFRDQEVTKAKLDAQTHRRCIKSHTAFDGIPFDPCVTYIAVYRHPIDVHFSMEKHASHMVSGILDFMYPEEPGAAFDRFLTMPATDKGTDDLTLASLLYHYSSFARFAHLPNVHIFHYADLSRDLPSMIKSYAHAIGIYCTEELSQDIAKAGAFGAMKEVTRLNSSTGDGAGAFSDETKFFDSGTSGKWHGRLTETEVNAYRSRMAESLKAEDVAWLETGGTFYPRQSTEPGAL